VCGREHRFSLPKHNAVRMSQSLSSVESVSDCTPSGEKYNHPSTMWKKSANGGQAASQPGPGRSEATLCSVLPDPVICHGILRFDRRVRKEKKTQPRSDSTAQRRGVHCCGAFSISFFSPSLSLQLPLASLLFWDSRRLVMPPPPSSSSSSPGYGRTVE